MAVSATGSSPVFLTVEVCAVVGPLSMSWGPSDGAGGERDSSVWVPVPERSTVTSGALDVTVSVADCAPVVSGSNWTRRVQVLSAVSVVVVEQSAGLVVRRWKLGASVPVIVIALSVTCWVPVFLTVEVCVAVGPLSMSWGPSDNAVGLGDSSVWVPVPERSTVMSAALDVTVRVALFAPVAGGSKRARRSQI